MCRTFRSSLLFGLALSLFAGCGAEHQAPHAGGPQVVRVSRPELREVTDYVYFTGRSEAVESVEVRSRVTGYLVDIDFKSGAEVTKGQRLFKIDPRPYQAEFDQAEGQVLLAKARLSLAKADVARGHDVAKTPGAISQQDLDRYESAAAEADASLRAAQASSESAALNLKFTDVVSPIDGIVGRNLLSVGNLVRQDTTLLTTVVSQDPIYVYFDVDERTLLRAKQLIREGKIKPISEGGVVKIDIGLANEGSDYPHSGRLDFVNNQVSAATGTIQLRCILENPQITAEGQRAFQPGMFVRVRLPMGQPTQELVIAQSAVNSNQGQHFLLVVNKHNVVEIRPVELGPQLDAGKQVVRPMPLVKTEQGLRPARQGEQGVASLAADDQVIVAGLQQARPGTTVDPKPLEDPSAMAQANQ
jgi:multidrug efflux system membrane fusion protein